MDPSALGTGVLYYIVFLLSTTLHEAAHAWSAKRGGDLTAYHGGQVSLDPRPHIAREPFGMVVLPVLSTLLSGWPFGYASAPYDPNWAMRYPKRAGWMAAAGPAANLLLVIAAVIVIRGGMLVGIFDAPASANFGHIVGTNAVGIWPGVAAFISIMFSMNLLLACLNLIPLPPLDGSAVILLFMSESTANKYQRLLWGTPMISMVGMLAAWRIIDVVFYPVFWACLSALYPEVSYS